MTLSTTHSGATSIEVAKRGMASVAQSRETKASSARQFCFSGSEKIWGAGGGGHGGGEGRE